MSMEYCHKCGKHVDTDFEEHECFWEKEEWNLSDKINFSEDVGKDHNYYDEDVQEFIRKVLDIVGKLPESADTVRAFHTIKELAGEKLISPQDKNCAFHKPILLSPEGDDIIKFRMVPWDKHGNKPKAEDVIKKKAREWVKKVDDEVYKTLTETKTR